MSAFIVSNRHINALIRFAINANVTLKGKLVAEDPKVFGQILTNENYRSVNYRYSENTPIEIYRHRLGEKILDPVTILKACDCYDYQSCETSDYPKTDAAMLINNIRFAAIHCLPGYDEAPWGLKELDEEEVRSHESQKG